MVLYIHKGGAYQGESGQELILRALKDYAPKKYTDIEILRDSFGKPFFRDIPVHFSISHTGEVWACLMAQCNVGVDIQRVRTVQHKKVASRFFTEDEANYIELYGVNGFFHIWTRKEAYVKFTGKGFAGQNFSSFSTVKKEENQYNLRPILGSAYIKSLNICQGAGCKEEIFGAYCFEKEEKLWIKEL